MVENMAADIKVALARVGTAPVDQQNMEAGFAHRDNERMAIGQIKDRGRIDQRGHEDQRRPLATKITQLNPAAAGNRRCRHPGGLSTGGFETAQSPHHLVDPCEIAGAFAGNQIKKQRQRSGTVLLLQCNQIWC